MSGEPNMVLRSVYLPPDVDAELRARAYENRTSKNDLIRQYIEAALGRGLSQPQLRATSRRGAKKTEISKPKPVREPARRVRATRRAATAPRKPPAGGRRPQRGTNARMVEEILQAAAPRAVRPAEIRKALHDKGVAMAFTSIRHALGQLESRHAAEQDGSTWKVASQSRAVR
jgi:hypothetical protein